MQEHAHSLPPAGKPRASPSAGFTLAELLVVLVIMGLLAAIVVPRLMGGVLGNANTKAAQSQIASFAATLDVFRLAVGRYPTTQEGLDALVTRPSTLDTWTGPYLNKEAIPSDPWGNPFQYEGVDDGKYFRVWTLGKDNAEGGEGEDADISSDR